MKNARSIRCLAVAAALVWSITQVDLLRAQQNQKSDAASIEQTGIKQLLDTTLDAVNRTRVAHEGMMARTISMGYSFGRAQAKRFLEDVKQLEELARQPGTALAVGSPATAGILYVTERLYEDVEEIRRALVNRVQDGYAEDKDAQEAARVSLQNLEKLRALMAGVKPSGVDSKGNRKRAAVNAAGAIRAIQWSEKAATALQKQ